MQINIPDPVFSVSVETDYSRSGRWYEEQTFVTRIEIGGITVMEREYNSNDSLLYVEDEADAKNAILMEFAEKIKTLLA